MNIEKPHSPCTGRCGMTPIGLCGGCLRTRKEIGLWSGLSDEEQREILKNIETRNSKEI
jgi:predicted Fe-S protein YdhL (DUF1289 family)